MKNIQNSLLGATLVFCSLVCQAQDSESKVSETPSFSKNIISYDFMSPLFGHFKVAYERVLGNGYVGIRVPFSYGDQFRAELGIDNVWSTGLEARIYPSGQGIFKYFFGLETLIAERQYARWNTSDPSRPIITYGFGYQYTAIYAKNGVIYYPYEHLGFNAALGLGVYSPIGANVNRIDLQETGYFELGVNYKF